MTHPFREEWQPFCPSCRSQGAPPSEYPGWGYVVTVYRFACGSTLVFEGDSQGVLTRSQKCLEEETAKGLRTPPQAAFRRITGQGVVFERVKGNGDSHATD
jgi:hypothetical protein